METAAFEPSEYSKEWDPARRRRYQHLVSIQNNLGEVLPSLQLRASLQAMYALTQCRVMHGDIGERNFLLREDGENTAAVIIDLGQAAVVCSPVHASSELSDTHSLFVQWGLDRKWCAEVADELRLKLPGANWDPTGPIKQGGGSVVARES
jgi:hypothetical protein